MTTKPRIELKRVSESRALSEETPGYTAQIWVDGKYFCDVANHGQGGPDSYFSPKGMPNSVFVPLLEQLQARIAQTFPKQTYEFNGETRSYDKDLESVCYALLDERATQAAVKRALNSRAKVLFVNGDGKLMEAKVKKPHTRDQVIAILRTKYPTARFLHEMPREEAAALLVRP